MAVDVLAIGAHPDDVELTVGGTIALLTSSGRSVGILDLTRGEMGTRGTPAQRAEEAAKAAEILGVSWRQNLRLADGGVAVTPQSRAKLVEVIRALRPKLVLGPWREDLHPDHVAGAQLIESVMYPTGLVNFPAAGEPWRPNEYLFYMSHYTFEPSFIVDVSEHMEAKRRAIACYASQLHQEGVAQRDTWIGRPDLARRIEARAIHYGSLIQKAYGEPFKTLRPVPMADPLGNYLPFGKV